jgi:hypothetical protein
MRNFTLVLLCICMYTYNYAQSHLQAENAFGGSATDRAYSIQQTKDGGYIVAGSTTSNNGQVHGNHAQGESDYWVVKLSRAGTIQWQTCLGGSIDEVAFSIQQTTDGGYIVAGEANSFNGQVVGNHGLLDVWVVKLDSSGNIIWSKALGGSNNDFATSVRQTKDGGYIVAGGTYSNDGNVTGHHGSTATADYWLIKLDASGNMQWQKTYGGSNGDIAMSAIQTKDGGYIVAGNSNSTNGDITNMHDSIYGDAWIVKTDKLGNIQWQKAYGGSDYEQANSIQQTNDGNYIAAGWTRSNDGDVTGNHGNYDFWVIKIDTVGNLKWQKCLGGSNGDLAYSIEQTTDNGYIVAGGTTSTDGQVTGLHGTDEDFWVTKLDVNGNLQWQQALGSNQFEEARSVDQTKDGGYVVAGWTGFANNNNGDVTGTHGDYDMWIVKLSANAGIVSTQNISIQKNLQFTLSPNPANDFIRLNIISEKPSVLLQVINSNGNIVQLQTISINKNTNVFIDVSKLHTGVYTATIFAGKDITSTQFIKN